RRWRRPMVPRARPALTGLVGQPFRNPGRRPTSAWGARPGGRNRRGRRPALRPPRRSRPRGDAGSVGQTAIAEEGARRGPLLPLLLRRDGDRARGGLSQRARRDRPRGGDRPPRWVRESALVRCARARSVVARCRPVARGGGAVCAARAFLVRTEYVRDGQV